MTRNGAARQEDVFVDTRYSAPQAHGSMKLLADEEDVAKAFQDKLGMVRDLAANREARAERSCGVLSLPT